MSVEISQMERVFEFEKNKKTVFLEDPNPQLEVSDVQDLYSTSYPELLNAKLELVPNENVLHYKFIPIVGTKG